MRAAGLTVSNSTKLFRAAAAFELVTGGAALAAPSLLVELLFGLEPDTLATNLTRFLGVALVAFGFAAWEPSGSDKFRRLALCVYNLGVAFLLAFVGLTSMFFTALGWGVCVLHLAIFVVLALSEKVWVQK